MLTNKINTYYSDLRFDISRFDFSLLDNAYGSFILELIMKLTFLEEINVQHLNLGDIFCEEFAKELCNRRWSNLKKIIITDNPRITNVGIKMLCMSLGVLKEDLADQSPIIEIKSKFSDAKTQLLDLGLKGAVESKIRRYFERYKMFCHECLKDVCSNCHKEWEAHSEEIEKCEDIVSSNNTVHCESFKKFKPRNSFFRMLTDWKFIFIVGYFLLYWPFILLNKVAELVQLIVESKCKSEE